MANFVDLADMMMSGASLGFDIKNFSDLARLSRIARGGISTFMGRKKSTGGSDDNSGGPAEVAENAMQAGELQSFLGYLAAVHSTDGKRITEYKIGARERDLYPAIAKAMKPGARKLLMQTLGVETIPVKKRRVVGYTEHEVNGKIVRSPETEETTERVNLAGTQITSALTWLALQGGGTKEARVQRVVEMLETFGIFHSKQDALKELGLKSADEVKRFMGWLDTNAHLVGAILAIGPLRLQVFLNDPVIDQAIRDIKAEGNLDRKRQRQEDLQGLIIAESKRVNVMRGQRTRKHVKWFAILFGIFATIVLVAGTYVGYPN
jgi:hypothetical protein